MNKLDKQLRCSSCKKIAWYKGKNTKKICKYCGAKLEKTRISLSEIVT